MANTFKLKRSAVAAKVPTTGDLQLGELALNTYDGRLYTLKDNGTASVVRLSGVTETALTFNNGGSGAASGTTFDGTTARTISYNSIGAPSTTGTNASGTWGISITGNAATASALQTGRTISLTGGVTGTSASWTGSGNLSIDTTVSNTSHKYHEFVAGTYFFDSYEQSRFFRLFTENYVADTVRFCPVQDVEFYNYTTSAWEAWAGGDALVKQLLDGRQETYADIDHAHRTFRFTVTKNTGWPTTSLLAMYLTWYGTSWTDITVTIEDAASTAGPWTQKRQVVWSGANTAANYGWHAYVTNDLHNGRTIARFTIDCADWVDNAGYIYKRINSLCLFSNFSGAPLEPWSWNYDKVVAFQATPTAPTAAVGTNTTALATTAFVNAEIANDAPTKTGGGASGTWGISVTGSAAQLNGISSTGLFNNMGETHSARQSFDATTASYDFGLRYVQGSTNGPGTGGSQFYSAYVGLGSQYPATGASSHGMYLAIDRYSTSPYLSVRYNENNSLGPWYRICAGKADTLTTARTINGTSFNGSANITTANWGTSRTLTIGSTGKAVDGSGNVSWSLAEIGAPSATGTGASGTWGISITGSAASCTGNAATATDVDDGTY